jgi:hypothetical protein
MRRNRYRLGQSEFLERQTRWNYAGGAVGGVLAFCIVGYDSGLLGLGLVALGFFVGLVAGGMLFDRYFFTED